VSKTASAAKECSTQDLLRRRGIEPRREAEFLKYCPLICDVKTREAMPIWNIKKIQGETNELIESMCYGRSYSGLPQDPA